MACKTLVVLFICTSVNRWIVHSFLDWQRCGPFGPMVKEQDFFIAACFMVFYRVGKGGVDSLEYN